jgi:hypothetical protein
MQCYNQMMRRISVSRRARSINALLKQAREENIIVRDANGREFMLAEIDDFDREIELTRQNKKLMDFLDRRARQTASVPLAEARKQLGLN